MNGNLSEQRTNAGENGKNLLNSDENPDIDWVAKACIEVAANKLRHGWKIPVWDAPNDIPIDLLLMHSEISEALEAFRKNDKVGFEKELADIVILLLGICHGSQINIKTATLAKIEENKLREYRHGRKRW